MTIDYVRIHATDLRRLMDSRESLQKNVNELQACMTAMVEAQLSRRVRAFHAKFSQAVAYTPHVPDDAIVRFRLKLIAEEFVELLDASVHLSEPDTSPDGGCNYDHVYELKRSVMDLIARAVVRVNLPEFADAMADLDYVVEGTRAAFGIHGEPIMAEVQRANMSKVPDYVTAKDAHHVHGHTTVKPVKPPGWKPPDVEGELRKQGWRP